MKKEHSLDYPRIVSLPPKTVLIIVLVLIIIAWSMVLLFDISNAFRDTFSEPVWRYLFNDRPIEWMQWFVLVFAIITSAYLSARLAIANKKVCSKFFLIFSIGLGLMLIEDAGDIRHVISGEVQNFADNDHIMGIHYRVVSDFPYFALLAAIPLYAIIRYGKETWENTKAKTPFILGIILYAIAAIGSGLRHFNNLYINIGSWIDENILNENFKGIASLSQDRNHFLLVDSILEETIELLAITLIFVAILIFVKEFKKDEADRSRS